MNRLFLIFIVYCLTGCGNSEEKKAMALETVLKKTTGVDADIDNLNHTDKNKATIEIEDEGLNLNQRFKDGFGTITATKETIAITITDLEGGQDNMLIGFTGKDLTKMRPIKGEMNTTGANTMSFSLADYSNNQAVTMTAFDVRAEIVSLKAEKIVIRIQGNMGYSADAQSPEKWEKFEGLITLAHPVFQALGSAKEDFVY